MRLDGEALKALRAVRADLRGILAESKQIPGEVGTIFEQLAQLNLQWLDEALLDEDPHIPILQTRMADLSRTVAVFRRIIADAKQVGA